jgi:hypothetical protein
MACFIPLTQIATFTANEQGVPIFLNMEHVWRITPSPGPLVYTALSLGTGEQEQVVSVKETPEAILALINEYRRR